MKAEAALLALCLAASPARAQSPDPDVLGRVGALATLIHRAQDPEVPERLRGALQDPRRELRAAAARVALVASVRPVLPELRAALAAEADAVAAAEEARALATLDQAGDSDSVLLSAVARLGEGGRGGVLEGIAAGRGVAATKLWPRLLELSLTAKDWSVFLAGFEQRGWSGIEAFGMFFLRDKPEAWGTYLQALRDARKPLDAGLLVTGLASDSAAVRVDTLWHVVAAEERPKSDSLPPVPAAAGAAERFPRELLNRASGGRSSDATSLIRELAADAAAVKKLRASRAVWNSVRYLSDAEREALSLALYRKGGRFPKTGPPAVAPLGPPGMPIRSVGPFPVTYAAGVLAATGCRPDKQPTALAAEVAFKDDGRLASVAFLESAANKSCVEAARTLVLSTIGGRRPGAAELLFAPLHADFMGCLVEPARDARLLSGRSDDETEGEGVLKEPRKIQNVPPIYPEMAKRQGRQGLVVLQTIVAPSGCIQSLEVVRSAHPALDVEAIRAVSQWRYSPTLLDGVPVPVVMTITVTFRLN